MMFRLWINDIALLLAGAAAGCVFCFFAAVLFGA